MPNAKFAITTVAGVGTCGSVDSVSGALMALNCGDLAIGGGNSSVPPGATPAGSVTRFSALGNSGTTRQIVGAPATISGSNRNCSRAGCFFGSPLPISNGPLSTCVDNTFTATASGTLNISTGQFNGSVPLQSAVTVTGNSAQPCPHCVGGLCDGNSSNAGAACTADSAGGESHDCGPIGPGLPPFAVDLTPISTGSASASDPGGIFCPGQANAGAFGQPAATSISENGVASTSSPTLVSIFCIPSTGNVLIDGSADLPGPGATSLPVSAAITAIP
jgi:hypothetical protein